MGCCPGPGTQLPLAVIVPPFGDETPVFRCTVPLRLQEHLKICLENINIWKLVTFSRHPKINSGWIRWCPCVCVHGCGRRAFLFRNPKKKIKKQTSEDVSVQPLDQIQALLFGWTACLCCPNSRRWSIVSPALFVFRGSGNISGGKLPADPLSFLQTARTQYFSGPGSSRPVFIFNRCCCCYYDDHDPLVLLPLCKALSVLRRFIYFIFSKKRINLFCLGVFFVALTVCSHFRGPALNPPGRALVSPRLNHNAVWLSSLCDRRQKLYCKATQLLTGVLRRQEVASQCFLCCRGT